MQRLNGIKKTCQYGRKKMDNGKVSFIRARQRKGDYVFDAIQQMGYTIVTPYKDWNLFFRCIREIWFLLGLPGKKIWFNKEIIGLKSEVIIIKDPLICLDLLKWIRKKHPNKRLLLDYDNRVKRSINPNIIDNGLVEKWSYDKDDCKEYSMSYKGPCYLDIYQLKKQQIPQYDILYVGRDKGRAEKLLDLKIKMEAIGLKTYFHITPDRSYQLKKKKFYQPYMPYRQYLEILGKSRVILNIMDNGQSSITQREMEAIFHKVKCITNNKGIRNFKLYHPSRFFILGEDNFKELKQFVDMPFKEIDGKQLKEFKAESLIERMYIGCQAED